MALSKGTDRHLQARSTNNMQLLPDAPCHSRCTRFPSRCTLIFGTFAAPRRKRKSSRRGSVRRGWVLHSFHCFSSDVEFTAYFSFVRPQRTNSRVWRTLHTATVETWHRRPTLYRATSLPCLRTSTSKSTSPLLKHRPHAATDRADSRYTRPLPRSMTLRWTFCALQRPALIA